MLWKLIQNGCDLSARKEGTKQTVLECIRVCNRELHDAVEQDSQPTKKHNLKEKTRINCPLNILNRII